MAKLSNCGLDTRGPLNESQREYLRQYGVWARLEFINLAQSAGSKVRTSEGSMIQSPVSSGDLAQGSGTLTANAGPGGSGFFAPSCLNHGDNLDFSTAPPIGGVYIREALSQWFFDSDPPRLLDTCGEEPCTSTADGGVCNHLPKDPLSAACQAALEADCAGLREKGSACDQCVREHAEGLRRQGCPERGAPVLAWWCEAPVAKGHHVCDVSI